MKKIFLLTLILVLLFSFTQLSAGNETDQKTMTKIGKLMEKVGKAMEKKDGQTAMKFIEEVLELKSDYAPALHQKARFFYVQDQAQAITLLEQAMSADENYLPAVKELAILYFQNAQKLQQTDPQAGAAMFEQVAAVQNLEMAEKGLLIESLFNAGAIHYQLQNMKGALPVFERLTGITELADDKQKNVIRLGHYMLGMAYVQSEQAVPAQNALREYITLSADMTEDVYLPVARFILAELIMTELNDLVGKINQDQQEEKTSRIAALAATKAEVVDLFGHVMTVKTVKPEITEAARMNLGNYYYMAADLDKAIAEYETLIRDFASSEQIAAYQAFLTELKAERVKRVEAEKNAAKGKKK